MRHILLLLVALIFTACGNEAVVNPPVTPQPEAVHPVKPGLGSTFVWSDGNIYTVQEVGMPFEGKANVTRLMPFAGKQIYFNYESNGDVSEWIDNEWVTFPISSRVENEQPEKDLVILENSVLTRQITIEHIGTAKDTVKEEVLIGDVVEVHYHLRTYKDGKIVDDRTNSVRRVWSKKIGFWTREMISFGGGDYSNNRLVRYNLE